jgi:hypothetical protein
MAKTTRGRRCNSLKCQSELTSSDPKLKPIKRLRPLYPPPNECAILNSHTMVREVTL